jgi:hypothetical protein
LAVLTASWPCIASTTKSVSTGFERRVQLADLGHQLLVDGQAPGGVDEEDVEVVMARVLERGARDRDRRVARARRNHSAPAWPRHRLELLDRRRPVDVGRDRQHLLLALLDQVLGELGGRRRLAGALQARHQDDRRRLRLQVEVGDAFAHRRRELAVDDADERLAGRKRAADLGAEGAVLDAGDEVAHHRQRDVGFEERHAHLAQHVLDVLVGDARRAAHRLDEPAQAIGEGRSHVVGVKYVSTLGRMILSFGPDAGAVTPTMLALSVPSVVALACYLARRFRASAFRAACTPPCWSAGSRKASRSSSTSPASAPTVPGARFGFAPALSVTLWLVLAVYELESRFVPLAGARRALATLGVVVVVLAWLFPARSSAGRVDLGAAALAARRRLVRPVRRRRPARAPSQSRRAADATRAAAARSGRARRSLAAPRAADVSLRRRRLRRLSAAIVLGFWFSDHWRWDHKSVFSILGWLVFAGLLAGRRAFGWRGRKATRGVYAGAALLLLAYVGSRFVLEVVLHRPPSA